MEKLFCASANAKMVIAKHFALHSNKHDFGCHGNTVFIN